jgi:hypothetical protein
MQFNYQKTDDTFGASTLVDEQKYLYTPVDEQKHSSTDFRKYGLLNKNLIDDEHTFKEYKLQTLYDELEHSNERVISLEKLCKSLRDDMSKVAQDSASLEKMLTDTQTKLANTEQALKMTMEQLVKQKRN